MKKVISLILLLVVLATTPFIVHALVEKTESATVETVVTATVEGVASESGEVFCPKDENGYCTEENVVWCWGGTGTSYADITASGGCADSGWDTSLSLTSAAEITSCPPGADADYCMYFPSTGDYFSATMPDAFDAIGTLNFDIYISTLGASGEIFECFETINVDQMTVNVDSGADDIQANYRWDTSNSAYCSNADSALVADTWFKGVEWKWRVGSYSPNLSLDYDGAGATTSDNNLSAWATGPSTCRIGNATSNATYFYLTRLKIYSTYN